METIEIAKKLALKTGYDHVNFYSRWNNADVYVAEYRDNETQYTGYPQFIIVINNQATLASSTETFEVLGLHPIDGKDYKGETL